MTYLAKDVCMVHALIVNLRTSSNTHFSAVIRPLTNQGWCFFGLVGSLTKKVPNRLKYQGSAVHLVQPCFLDESLTRALEKRPDLER
jgi:hypothetical protein